MGSRGSQEGEGRSGMRTEEGVLGERVLVVGDEGRVVGAVDLRQARKGGRDDAPVEVVVGHGSLSADLGAVFALAIWDGLVAIVKHGGVGATDFKMGLGLEVEDGCHDLVAVDGNVGKEAELEVVVGRGGSDFDGDTHVGDLETSGKEGAHEDEAVGLSSLNGLHVRNVVGAEPNLGTELDLRGRGGSRRKIRESELRDRREVGSALAGTRWLWWRGRAGALWGGIGRVGRKDGRRGRGDG